jgi:hypothetical protein
LSAPVETFDLASLEAFIADLVAHGFEPVPGGNRRLWRARIHPAFAPLTSDSTMLLALVDGWPFKPPALFVDGLASNHATLDGLVCMWREDDATGKWTTVGGLFARIKEWCDDAQHGWNPADLGRDARLNFRRKARELAVFDFDSLGTTPGSWGEFQAQVIRDTLRVHLRPGRAIGGNARGMWFHVGELALPPRNLSELQRCLPRSRWRQLRRALDDRRMPDPLQRSGGVDFVLFCWDRKGTTDLLVLAIGGTSDSVEAWAMQPGPNDEATLILRAGPDATALRDRTVAVFGAGALGGYVAVVLAESGVGCLHIVDAEVLAPGNVVRHVAGHSHVGEDKVRAVEAIVKDHAPWTRVTCLDEAAHTPSAIDAIVSGVDLIVDATGNGAVTNALTAVAVASGKPVVSGALYRGGSIGRVRRSACREDTPFDQRGGDRYPIIPPANDDSDFVTPSLGCSAPVNNAAPVSVLACAALVAQSAIDVLIGRLEMDDEVIDVYRPLVGSPPFDSIGRVRAT